MMSSDEGFFKIYYDKKNYDFKIVKLYNDGRFPLFDFRLSEIEWNIIIKTQPFDPRFKFQRLEFNGENINTLKILLDNRWMFFDKIPDNFEYLMKIWNSRIHQYIIEYKNMKIDVKEKNLFIKFISNPVQILKTKFDLIKTFIISYTTSIIRSM